MPQANDTTRPYTPVRVLRDLGLIALSVLMFMVGAGMSLSFGLATIGSEVVNRGVAVARDCDYGGPLESGAPGWWWTCRADVTWQDGTHERRTFKHSQLTGDDIGQRVQVVERRISSGQGKGSSLSVYRANFDPSAVWGIIVAAPFLLCGCAIAIVVLTSWWGAVKRALRGSDQ